MFRTLPTITAFAAVLIAGIVPGLWTGRWQSNAALEAVETRLAAVPVTVGAWTGRDLDVSPREKEISQATGILRRRYVHSRTGGTLSLVLVAGRPGPVSVHTPDICIRGSGFDEVGAPTRLDASTAGDQLWVRRFQKVAVAPVYTRVVYGWSAGGPWQAPENPRLTFAAQPVLYKLYVVRELARPDEPLEDDPAVDFLRTLLPSLGASLFPPA